MSEISHFSVFAAIIADGLAVFFATAALVHLVRPNFLWLMYRRWGYARSFVYVAGILMAATALFLGIPPMRVWGGILGAMILFVAITTMLNRERYLYAVSMMFLLAALVPAMA